MLVFSKSIFQGPLSLSYVGGITVIETEKISTGHPVQCLTDSYWTEHESIGPKHFGQDNTILTETFKKLHVLALVIIISGKPYMFTDHEQLL